MSMDGAVASLPRHQTENFDSQCSNNRISPRNSKWLQQNVRDMEAKVKAVVTLIEEDASSFNRKAEMYFSKRPELMKLVEELDRAYRALSERYNYTNGELQWFQRAMMKAFPGQLFCEATEDSSFRSSAYSQTPELGESKDVLKKESEVRNLKKALSSLSDEKEIILLKYQQIMKKLSDVEEELNCAKTSSMEISEQESEAKSEAQRLKKAIAKVEVERDSTFLHQKEHLERISILEHRISQVREEGFSEGSPRAEIRSKCLENEVSRLATEKENSFFQYKSCLGEIADLERRISLAENEAGLHNKRAYRAESEVKKLKNDLDQLNEEKKLVAVDYNNCLVNLSKLESELSCAEDELRRISSEDLVETGKLNNAEEKYATLEILNKSLKSEAMFSEMKTEMMEKELEEKQKELEKLEAHLHDEQLRCLEVEAAILTMQKFQSEEENGSSVLEIREVLRLLKEFDLSQESLEEEQEITPSVEDLESKVLKLKEIKQKLEEEIEVQKGLADTLQKEIYVQKEDIKDLNNRYQSLMEKIRSSGLNPESLGSSIKALKDENSKLRETYEETREEKQVLSNNLTSMEQILNKNATMEKSFQLLNEDKFSLTSEKAALLSQLRTITNCVKQLSEKNIILENPLYVANTEIEDLKTKSENLEELYESLNSENSSLFDEKSRLNLSMENVEKRLKHLENKFSETEKKCEVMENENKPRIAQIEDLKVSLGLEKSELSNLELSSEARLASLEKHLKFLQEETKWSKMELEEEVRRAVNIQFEIFILQNIIQDLEMKNHCLSIECENHIESSKLRENLVLELERENLEQQVEIELLISEIEKLRGDIAKVFKALELCPDELIDVNRIIENIEYMKRSLLSFEDDKQKLLVENLILLTLLSELRSEGAEIIIEKNILNKELENTTVELMMVQNGKKEVENRNEQLNSDINKEKEIAEALKAETEKLYVQQSGLEGDFLILKKEHCEAIDENKSLMKSLIDLKKEKCLMEEEIDSILIETLVLQNNYTVFKNFGNEKDMEIDSIYENLQNLSILSGDLRKEVDLLRENMEIKDGKNSSLKDAVKKLEKELCEGEDLNNEMRKAISDEMTIICEKEMEILLVEEKIKATEDRNIELCKTLEELTRNHEETVLAKENIEEENFELAQENRNQSKEILFLHEANRNLSWEIEEKKNEFKDLNNQFRNEISAEAVMLCQKEIEISLSEEELKSQNEETMVLKEKLEKKISELTEENENQSKELKLLQEINKNLNLKLNEMKKETEIWEDEASIFQFELQTSKAYEVVLEDKASELSGTCKTLGNEIHLKSDEIENMKERVDVMENEIDSVKAELSSYAPAIDTIIANMELLELKVLDQHEIKVDDVHESKEEKVEKQVEEQKSAIPNRLQELLDLQMKIKSLEKVLAEKKQPVATHISTFTEIEPVIEQESELKESELVENSELEKTNSEVNLSFEDVKQGRNDISSPPQEENELSVDKIEVPNERKLNEAKLDNLQKIVQDLKMKTERSKKRKMKTVDFEMMKKQLTEVEETVVQLSPEENQLSSHTKDLAIIEPEKTKQLKLEIQVIRNMFLKLENGKQSSGEVRVLNRPSVIAKSFFRSGSRTERNRRKGLFGCCRPSSNAEVVSNNR